MLHQALDKLRIDAFAAENAFCILLHAVHHDARPVGAVAAIGARSTALNRADGRNHAAMISVIIVAAEHIRLVIILIFNRDIQTAHALSEQLRHIFALRFAAIGMTAPAHINIGNIIQRLPVLAFQQSCHTGTIRSLRIAKDTEGRLAPCVLMTQAILSLKLLAVILDMLAHKVQLLVLFKTGSQKYSLVHHLYNRGHRVAEKTADTRRNVDTRTLQLRQRDNLQTVDTLAAALPYRTDTHQIEEFRNALTVAAHIRPRPEHHADAFRIMTFLRNKAFNNLIAQRFAYLPGCRRRQTARVDTVEVAACRQKVSTAAHRRTARPRLDILALKAAQHIRQLLLRQHKMRINLINYIAAYALQLFLRLRRGSAYPRQLQCSSDSLLSKALRLQHADKLAALLANPVDEQAIGNIQRLINQAAVFQKIVIIKAI